MAVEKPFTGLTASVKIGDELLGYVSGVDMNLEKDIIEILAFGHEFKEKVPSIKDWTASIDGTVALVKDGSQKKLYDAFNSATEIEIGVYLDATTFFKGKAYAKNFNISASPDDKITLKSELSGNGATTLTVPN